MKTKINKIRNIKLPTRTFSFKEVLIISVITIGLGLFAGATITHLSMRHNSLSRYQTMQLDNNLRDFITVYNALVNNYYRELDRNTLISSALKGMLGDIDDPYTVYMDQVDTSDFSRRLNGRFTGVGMEIVRDQEGNVIVLRPFDSGPAYKAGIRTGDIIVKVDDSNLEDKSLTDVANMIQGPIDTFVNITIKREGKEQSFRIKRATINIRSVTSHIIEEEGSKIGYININIFSSLTTTQFNEELKSLQREGIDSLIIDVRSNRGGYLNSVHEILDNFLTRQDVLYQIETSRRTTKRFGSAEKRSDLPIVVLVNDTTASAAEILAAALKESYGAKLVGTKTLGKGTVQQPLNLSSGAMVKFTTQNWLTPKGKSLNESGITPDYLVTLNERFYREPTPANDNQLQKAIELLK